MNLNELSEQLARGELSAELLERLADIELPELRAALGVNLREEELVALLERIQAVVTARHPATGG